VSRAGISTISFSKKSKIKEGLRFQTFHVIRYYYYMFIEKKRIGEKKHFLSDCDTNKKNRKTQKGSAV
jgi:hypothetical protein